MKVVAASDIKVGQVMLVLSHDWVCVAAIHKGIVANPKGVTAICEDSKQHIFDQEFLTIVGESIPGGAPEIWLVCRPSSSYLIAERQPSVAISVDEFCTHDQNESLWDRSLGILAATKKNIKGKRVSPLSVFSAKLNLSNPAGEAAEINGSLRLKRMAETPKEIQ
jgi:hypothetical protein